MKKLLLFISTIFVIWIIFGNGIGVIMSRFNVNLSPLEKISENIKMIERQILAPPPLVSSKDSENSLLTNDGVVRWTNNARNKNNLVSLKTTDKLNKAALNKANDIIKNQYFEHISPTGVGPADLVGAVGYEYIVVGENLALGNFSDDEELVFAWMQSPGHRANILNVKYTELGVAVVNGVYEGKKTWVAVQEFGLPLSVCTGPDKTLKAKIDDYKKQSDDLEKKLTSLKVLIEKPSTRISNLYKTQVNSYNALVVEYNGLLANLKKLISQYNVQIDKFNLCINQ